MMCLFKKLDWIYRDKYLNKIFIDFLEVSVIWNIKQIFAWHSIKALIVSITCF